MGVERKKAMRLAKQVRRKIEKNDVPEDLKDLKHDLHVAEVDEAYTQHFPHAEAYISLYTNSRPEAAGEDGEESTTAKDLLKTPRPPMWKTVEEAMKEGPGALRRLRERRPQNDSPAECRTERKAQKSKPATRVANATIREQQRQPRQETKEKSSTLRKEQHQTGLNRRERRRQMHQAKAPVVQSEGDSDDGGFFEED